MTKLGAVLAEFRAHPGEWIDDERLIQIGGRDAWSARVRDCRKAPYRMTIENRQIRYAWGIRSQYRWVPRAPAQAGLWEGAA